MELASVETGTGNHFKARETLVAERLKVVVMTDFLTIIFRSTFGSKH